MPRINDSVPRITNVVPRNVYPPPSRQRKESTETPIAPFSDVRVRVPLTRIDSSVWHNSSQKICPPVPRNNVTDSSTSATATAPPPSKRKRNRVQRRERRAREREERARIDEAFNHDARWTAQSLGAPSSTTVSDPLTTIGLYRTATLYQPCGPRCTRLSHSKVGHQPIIIRVSNLDRSLVNL